MTVRGDETREREIAAARDYLGRLALDADLAGKPGVATRLLAVRATFDALLAELAAARQENAQLREVYEAGQAVMDHWQLRIGGTRPLTAPEERFAAALAAVTGNEPREPQAKETCG